MDDSRMEGLLAALEGGIRQFAEAGRVRLPTLLRPKDAARELSVSLKLLRAMVDSGAIATVAVGTGGRRRIPAAEIQRFARMAATQAAASAPPAAAPSPRRAPGRASATAYDTQAEAEKLKELLKGTRKRAKGEDS